MIFSVSVAIITRNRQESLRRCLLSLLSQRRLIHEVLVVDNGSEDETKQVVEEFKNSLPVRYLYEAKPGIPNARNLALTRASGTILAFLDDDCEANANWVAGIVETHKTYQKAVAIQGWSESMPKGGLISIISQFNRQNLIQNSIAKQTPAFRLSSDIGRLGKVLPITVLDTKNVSFKLGIIRKYSLRFDHKLHRRGADIDFAKQIIAKGQTILFSANIRASHWERDTVGDFISQRFGFGRGATTIAKKWPNAPAPSMRPLAIFRRLFEFTDYCFRNGYARKLPFLIPLFLIEKNAYFYGQRYEFHSGLLKREKARP